MDILVSPRRRTLLQALGAASLLAACGEHPRSVTAAHTFQGPAMGSTYTLKIADATLSARTLEAAHGAVHRALATVEGAMSSFRADSELSALNAHADGTPFPLSVGLVDVLERAREVGAMSAGAFDVTVAPLVDAWGFGPTRTRQPDVAGQRGTLGGRVGWWLLDIDASARTASKARPDVRIDLSGIAKGYGVDRAALALDSLGIGNYLIEAGGEVRTRGRNGAGEPWQVAIERPDVRVRAPHYVVPLTDLSMATSGDYRIFYEQDGVRYSHEIDPVSGAPVRHALASVTVLAADCTRADAWSTALFVLGPDAGYALAQTHGIAAYFISRGSDGRLADRATSAFAPGGRRVPA